MSKIDEYKDNIQKFANKHKLVFNDEGECGFGRDCVGLLHGDQYVAFNPYSQPDYEPIEDFQDDRFNDIAPSDAYHKHDCIAVLGHGEEPLKQLSEWVDKLDELGATVESYVTGATGIQALISGAYGNAIKLPKP